MVFCPHQPCSFLCHWRSYREEVCFLLTGILNSIKEDLVLLKNLTLMTGAVGILTENEPCFCHMCTERNQLLKQAGQYCFRCKISNQVDSSWGCTVWSIYNQVWRMVIWNSTDRTGNKGQSAISRWACIHVPGVYGGEAFFSLFVYLFSFFPPSLPLSFWHWMVSSLWEPQSLRWGSVCIAFSLFWKGLFALLFSQMMSINISPSSPSLPPTSNWGYA